MLAFNQSGMKTRFLSLCLIFMILSAMLIGCSDRLETSQSLSEKPTTTLISAGNLSEVALPPVIQKLRQNLEQYQPQVTILSPLAAQTLSEAKVKVRLEVRDLPIYIDEKYQMGPHLHLILDNEPYQEIYDLSQPIVLNDLSPGTHTLRVFAVSPWGESFKNNGAYAQATFHVFTETEDNQPNPSLPLLTYSSPQGIYGAEPIMLDFYLTNAPLHLIAQANSADEIADWRVKVTINDESFFLDNWQPIYLKGFKKGDNWVHLEFIDEQGEEIDNTFNDTVRVISYDPKYEDTLSQITKGKLSVAEVKGIVDPNYQPPIPAQEALEEEEEVETPAATVTPEETTSLEEEEEEVETPAAAVTPEETTPLEEEEEEVETPAAAVTSEETTSLEEEE